MRYVDKDGNVIETAFDAIKAADRAEDILKAGTTEKRVVSKAVHGNSAASTKAQHAYDISEKGTDRIVKNRSKRRPYT